MTRGSARGKDATRSIENQQQPPFEVTPELEAWLVESADKSTTPLTSDDFDSIRMRVRARTKPSAAG